MPSADWQKASASTYNGNCVEVRWRKAKKSFSNGNCVEVAPAGDGGVQVRDSKNPGGAILTFTPAEWDAFLDGAAKGEFNLTRLHG
jgi:hypothetical protein